MEKKALYEKIVVLITAYAKNAGTFEAVLEHTATLLHRELGHLWTGFYLWCGDALYLGPYCGDAACERIRAGRGVCGQAYEARQTIVVPDVSKFVGHIACSTDSRSEIVVPIFASDGSVYGVIDIDSRHLAAFDDEDREGLEKVAAALTQMLEIYNF
ncbi:MAG: GAF domain-containing protein [Bacteroidaceae bacterium]|nr:GAF domain-containing protein [Bacteroidaceae bacterium]